MLMLKPIKKKPIINSALPDKLKHMIKSLNQPKYKDKSEHKCKNKAFLLIKEPTNLFSLQCILTVKCGNKDVMRQPFLSKD